MGLNALDWDNDCVVFISQTGLTPYWQKVKKVLDADGKPKYLHLATLALVVLCLPQGNSEQERGFSVNKELLDVRSILINCRFLSKYTVCRNDDIVAF